MLQQLPGRLNVSPRGCPQVSRSSSHWQSWKDVERSGWKKKKKTSGLRVRLQDRGRGIWPSRVSSPSLSLCVSVSLNKSCKPSSI